MAKQKGKKVNPRRIPLAKREIDKDAILEEATKDDLYHAWLLVFSALIEQEQIPRNEFSALTESVNQYIHKPPLVGAGKENNNRRAEKLMGMPCPYSNLNLRNIKSQVELDSFKQKVRKVAIYTALSVLCLGLYSTGKFTEEDLHRLFFHVDLTLAEIEHGTTTYTNLEKQIAASGVEVERESDDLHHARIHKKGQQQ